MFFFSRKNFSLLTVTAGTALCIGIGYGALVMSENIDMYLGALIAQQQIEQIASQRSIKEQTISPENREKLFTALKELEEKRTPIYKNNWGIIKKRQRNALTIQEIDAQENLGDTYTLKITKNTRIESYGGKNKNKERTILPFEFKFPVFKLLPGRISDIRPKMYVFFTVQKNSKFEQQSDPSIPAASTLIYSVSKLF